MSDITNSIALLETVLNQKLCVANCQINGISAGCYLASPSTMDTLDRVRGYDGIALRAIQDAEEMIETLKDYRLDLCARYQLLSTAPYTCRLELKRDPHWNGKKFYYVNLYKVFQDKALGEIVEKRTEYPGTERRQAIADYNAYKKSHPGIEATMDIERRAWEK